MNLVYLVMLQGKILHMIPMIMAPQPIPPANLPQKV